jgi:hypothetical protein
VPYLSLRPDVGGPREDRRMEITRLLDFERANPGNPSRKEDRVRATFGRSLTRYYQALNLAIDTAEAARYDPMLVHSLRRARAARLEARRNLAANRN